LLLLIQQLRLLDELLKDLRALLLKTLRLLFLTLCLDKISGVAVTYLVRLYVVVRFLT
jgi:hypothetical protein